MVGPKSLQAELGIVNDSLESCVMIYFLNCDMVDSRAALCLIHRNANMWAVYVRYLHFKQKIISQIPMACFLLGFLENIYELLPPLNQFYLKIKIFTFSGRNRGQPTSHL